MLEITGYDEKYRSQMMIYLRRIYPFLSDKSDEYVNHWFDKRAAYKWVEDIDINEYPYKYGVLFIDNNIIVGYLGLIYSYVYIDNRKLVFLNFTGWEIDKPYGFHIYTAMNRLMKTADIVGEFTPSDIMRKICLELYHFKSLDTGILKFLPIPSIRHTIKSQIINDEHQITDFVSRNKYIDHIQHDVKCIKYTQDDDCLYVFYKGYPTKVKRYFTTKLAVILDISDTKLFAGNLHEILWDIQRRGYFFVNVEERFLCGKQIDSTCKYKKSKNNKLVYCTTEFTEPLGLLYSELAMR